MHAAADRHTDRHTQTRVTTIHFASSTTHATCSEKLRQTICAMLCVAVVVL